MSYCSCVSYDLVDSGYALFIVRWWLHEVLVCLTMYAYMVVLFGLTFFTRGNSVGDYRSLCRAVMGSISPNKWYLSHVRVRWEQWQHVEESDLRSRLMTYSLVSLRKSCGGCAGLTEALLVSLSWR